MVLNRKPCSTIAETYDETASGTVGSESSLAVKVNEPPAFSVTVSWTSPAASCVGDGRLALTSVEAIDTMCVIEVTVCHVASHARTLIVNGTPAVCAAGAPVFPEVVPGAAVSPGSSTCSFV